MKKIELINALSEFADEQEILSAIFITKKELLDENNLIDPQGVYCLTTSNVEIQIIGAPPILYSTFCDLRRIEDGNQN